VYIDQDVARAFLNGTKKERTDVLAKFQNLERFSKALASVAESRKAAELKLEKHNGAYLVVQERIRGLKKQLSMLIEDSKKRTQQAADEVEKLHKIWGSKKLKNGSRIEHYEVVARVLEGQIADVSEKHLELERRHLAAVSKRVQAEQELQKITVALDYDECPTCHQKVDKKTLDLLEHYAHNRIKEMKQRGDKWHKRLVASGRIWTGLEVKLEEINSSLHKLKDEVATAKFAYTETKKAYLSLWEREQNESWAREKAENDLIAAREERTDVNNRIELTVKRIGFYQYCEQALSRDGIPAFLNALLCPVLNRVADFYAELFGDKAVQVRFELENGEFVPRILNATGGEAMEDQSSGERALAGLIASFALREAAPQCNVLILAEPGEGLDPATASQFTEGLTKLGAKFESIFLTTHNPAIMGGLASRHELVVVKKNGVSRLVA
jgi:DNA repair exonuclease SbcCD ATPase subunit